MNNSQVTFDASQFHSMVYRLTGPEMKKVIVSTLRSSSNILKKETERQFHTRVTLNGYKISYKKSGKTKTKVKRLVTVVIDKKEMAAKVHILGDFRAKFFELGTRERYTKGHKITGSYYKGRRKYLKRTGKPGRRGKIEAGHHFKTAQDLTRERIFSEMDQRTSKAIIKIAKA